MSETGIQKDAAWWENQARLALQQAQHWEQRYFALLGDKLRSGKVVRRVESHSN